MEPRLRFVGLDVHKHVLQACILDAAGEVVLEDRRELTRAGLVAWASVKLRATDRVALESTTNAWAVVQALKDSVPGLEVVVSNPLQTKAIAWARLKSDKVDARMLAHLLRCDLLPEVWQPDERTQAMRGITSRRVALVQDRTAVKNRLHSALHQRLVDVPEGVTLFTKRGRAWLKEVCPSFGPVGEYAVLSDLRLLEALDQEIFDLETLLCELDREDPQIKLLMTLPGVDAVVAHTLLSTLGDITRFPTAAKAASYFGLTQKYRQSADKARVGRISKAGSSHARWLMVQAAQAASRSTSPLAGFYRRLRKRRNCHNLAVVAVARKLVVYAWHILKNNEPYRYAHPGATATKLAKFRTRGGGPRRPPGPRGQITQRIYRDNEKVLPALGAVYEVEGLPEHRGFDALPDGEKKVIRKLGMVRKIRALEKIQRVPRKAQKPHQKPLRKEGGKKTATRG